MKVLQSTLRKQYTHGLPSAAPAFSCFPFFILRQRDTLAAIHISTLGLYSYPNNAAPVTYPRCRIFNVIFQFQYVFAFSAGTHPEIPHRIRACLKIGDVPSGEGFWAAGKQFFRRNPGGFQGKIVPSRGQKIRRLGMLTCFKQALDTKTICAPATVEHQAIDSTAPRLYVHSVGTWSTAPLPRGRSAYPSG